MNPKEKLFKSGKLEIALLRKLLEKYTLIDSQVIVGPEIGEDAAVVDLGKGEDRYLIITSDPITFTTEEMGYYGVVVNVNDIATRGGIPKWFLATLLFPEKGADQNLIEKIFSQIHKACRQFKISFIGGHTEITPGLDRPILSGHMIGEVKKDRLVRTSGAKEGDLLLLAKGVCIEGTSIMAREKEKELRKKGYASSFIQRAKHFIFNPGIDVLEVAQIASQSAHIHAMHDPTEGGLINGIIEMAWACKKQIEVDFKKVFIYEESKILCREFGINPLGTIASGALLIALPPDELLFLEKAFKKNSIPIQVIGKIKKGPSRVMTDRGKELKPIERDEILKIY
jgi:hydrogenase maturation factor